MRVRYTAMIGIFTALSVAGAALKIPAVIGSVAFDVFPALVASVLLGTGAGAIIAGLGHLVSALLGGLPLGPFHILVAIEMAFLVWIFGRLYQSGKKKPAGLVFLIGNAFAAPVPFLFIMGKEFYLAVVPSLLLGSILNITAALLLIPRFAQIVEHLFVSKGEGR